MLCPSISFLPCIPCLLAALTTPPQRRETAAAETAMNIHHWMMREAKRQSSFQPRET